MQLNSKTVVSALALVALLATPALAQKARKQQQAPAAATQNLYNRVDSNVVVGIEGNVIGADPDPQIRAYLLRDEGTVKSGE
jgi:hypothetical protein